MAQQQTHTPGPWFVFDGAYMDNGPGAYQIGDAPTSQAANVLCSRHQWPERANEMRANARLIAAAPDLLAALRAVLSEWERLYPGTKYQSEQLEAWEDFEFRQMNTARAAIARATGADHA